MSSTVAVGFAVGPASTDLLREPVMQTVMQTDGNSGSSPAAAAVRVAVNGLGRIGRTFLKLALERQELDVVAVNDIGDADNLAYLMRYDSVYGRYAKPVGVDRVDGQEWLRVGDHRLVLLHQREPRMLPWRALQVDVVVEATGVFETYAAGRAHLEAGAGRVVLTAPAKDADTDDARTVLMGVNADALTAAVITTNGSCTTNSASAVMQILQDQPGVSKAFLNTVHGYTATQRLVDSPGGRGDFRRGRAAAANIVPAATGAATAVARAIPALRDRFDGLALRVPVPAGSLSAIVFLSARATTAEEINARLEAAAQTPRWRSVLGVTHDPLVSSDIIGQPYGAIVDLTLTRVIDGDLCAIYCWYDNELGFTHTLLEHVLALPKPH
ncbi:type I glyceraldehyde-3-phosphate dehydrogenase [Luteitalea sp.]